MRMLGSGENEYLEVGPGWCRPQDCVACPSPGETYRNNIWDQCAVETVEQCVAKCDSHSDCRGFTFVAADPMDTCKGKPRCMLFKV